MDPLSILRHPFGYSAFRFNQEAVIRSVLDGKDTFVLMPTGGGKSLCYQVPALILDGLTLVVSPLIALMKDQVDALRAIGIPAAFLNSTLTAPQQETILQEVREKKLKLLYLAPEKLLAHSTVTLQTLKDTGVSLIAIDEAHCISHWGHDFRPEYLMLSRLKSSFPQAPVIALTATADKLTREDIIGKLELQCPAVFVSSFNRPNIRYSVQPRRRDVFGKLLEFLTGHREDSGIIYCLSRKSTERLAEELQLHGFRALPYHAGMDRDQRTKHQDMFLRDEVKIMVATIAFGMGIDKPNVRYVVHMDLPKNIESYYQETGRAGRDGLPCEALLFFSYGDVLKMKRFALIENNPEQTDLLLRKLDQMGRYGDLTTCRRKYLLNYFGEHCASHCGNCDRCLEVAKGRPVREANTIGALLRTAVPSRQRTAPEKELYDKLSMIRREFAARENLREHFVVPDEVLQEMAAAPPDSLEAMENIAGFGKVRCMRYGRRFLSAIRAHRRKVHAATRPHVRETRMPENGKQDAAGESRQRSLHLFREGYSVARIAGMQNLVTGTVEEHLAACVREGTLSIDELLKPDKIIAVRQAIDRSGSRALKPLKTLLGDDYSYADIRYVLADMTCAGVKENAMTSW